MYSKTLNNLPGSVLTRMTLCRLSVAVFLLISLCAPHCLSETKHYQKGVTLDLSVGPVWGKGGHTYVFDRYRQTIATLGGGQSISGGIRFGFDISRHFAVGFSMTGLTNDYSVRLADSRTDDPEYPEAYWLPIESTEIGLFLGEISYRPLQKWFVPYATFGVGIVLIEPDDTNAKAVSAATGIVLYPIRNLGFRFEGRVTRSSVSGLVPQSSPKRMIPYSDRLTFSEISAGIVIRVFTGQD